MLLKSVVTISAWLEILVGVLLIAAANIACQLLFATPAEAVALILGRFVGVALLALGVACLPSRTAPFQLAPVRGLFVYNLGVAVLLAWVGFATAFHGILLWPAVILHFVIAAALVPQLMSKDAA